MPMSLIQCIEQQQESNPQRSVFTKATSVYKTNWDLLSGYCKSTVGHRHKPGRNSYCKSK